MFVGSKTDSQIGSILEANHDTWINRQRCCIPIQSRHNDIACDIVRRLSHRPVSIRRNTICDTPAAHLNLIGIVVCESVVDDSRYVRRLIDGDGISTIAIKCGLSHLQLRAGFRPNTIAGRMEETAMGKNRRTISDVNGPIRTRPRHIDRGVIKPRLAVDRSINKVNRIP